MRKQTNIQNKRDTESVEIGGDSVTEHVNAETIGSYYAVTGRYILKLAEEGKIPCLRIGKKCVRFDPKAVAAALEKSSSEPLASEPRA